MSANVVIVDYGMGNLHSVKRKLDRLNVEAVVSSDPNLVVNAEKVILPGVGHFTRAAQQLDDLHLREALNDFALQQKKPVLGICLGMQLMASNSEEGTGKGLGWFDATCVRFQVSDPLKFKVPHMGWNQVDWEKSSILNKAVAPTDEFYFVHSFYLRMEHQHDVLNSTEYDFRFTSAIEKDNIFGVQYHPEKSHDAGERLLNNFIQL